MGGALRRQPRFFGLRPGGGCAPAPGCVLIPRIIYDGNESINNSHKNRVGAGAQPPAKPQNERPARVEGMSSVPGGATPSATPPHANARMRHNRHQTSYEIMLILKK